MTLRRGRFRSLCLMFAVTTCLVLSGCESSRKKADIHVETARSLLAQDESASAVGELRAALSLHPEHRAARALLSATLLDLGNPIAAVRQYSRLLTYHPDDVEALQAVGNAAVSYKNWQVAAEHLERLEVLAPSDPATLAIGIALDFRAAATARDDIARRQVAVRARDLSAELPGNPTLRFAIIDSLLLDGDDHAALAEIEAAQTAIPANLELYRRKLRILGWLGDIGGTEALLEEMVEVFPDSAAVRHTVVRFYLGLGRRDEAEAFLRRRATAADADVPAKTALVEFLAENRGVEAAIAQCDAFISQGGDTSLFKTLRASYLFNSGETDTAILEMEDLLATLEPGLRANQAKVALARMLLAGGNTVGARAQIEEVLARNPSMIGALVLRATRLIELDRVDEALADLNRAAEKAPANPLILTTQANAYLRLGETETALEHLAAAAAASGNAPTEAIRYADLLVQSGQLTEARTALYESMRIAPNSVQVLSKAGRVNLRMEDWSAVEEIEGHLRSLGSDEATTAADGLRASLLYQQDRQDDALAFLEELARQDQQDLGVQVAILRAHLSRGDFEEARDYAAQMLARAPDDPRIRFVSAAVHAATGDPDAARAAYRSLIDDGDGDSRAMVELARLEISAGRIDDAEDIILKGLEAYPGNVRLQWLWAGQLQQLDRHEEAIAVLEALYNQDSATDSVANNLASLLSTHRSDEDSLERAHRIARRLRDSSVPAYADTFGWIAYLRGDYDEAYRHLEMAARALHDEPSVHVHLAMTYLALDRKDEAIAAFRRALEVSGDSTTEAAETARQQLEQLQ